MSFMEIGVEKTYTIILSEEKRNTLLLQLEQLNLTGKEYCEYIVEFIELLKSAE